MRLDIHALMLMTECGRHAAVARAEPPIWAEGAAIRGAHGGKHDCAVAKPQVTDPGLRRVKIVKMFEFMP
jgi:hypothetical protein